MLWVSPELRGLQVAPPLLLRKTPPGLRFPGVMGNPKACCEPAMYALPVESMAIRKPKSALKPPKNVEETTAPPGSRTVKNASRKAAIEGWNASAETGKFVEAVQPVM